MSGKEEERTASENLYSQSTESALGLLQAQIPQGEDESWPWRGLSKVNVRGRP